MRRTHGTQAQHRGERQGEFDREKVLQALSAGERGRAAPLVPTLAGVAGAIVLAIGVASDSSVTAVIGGVVLGVGLLATTVLNHITIDYHIFSRLDDLEK